MVAYSFQKRFVAPIEVGTKGGTIRVTRRGNHQPGRLGGHARAGERVRLYYGMRTKQCRLIAEKLCIGVAPISIHFEPRPKVHIPISDTQRICYSAQHELDAFARFDGFESFADLAAFWRKTHGALTIFDGWHIRWEPLPGEKPPYIVPLV